MRVFYPAHSRSELIELLRQRVHQLAAQLPLRRATLFGSWSRDRATAFSDVDLLIVYEGPPRDDAYELTWRTIGLRSLEAHVYSEGEARQVAETLARMTANGVELLD